MCCPALLTARGKSFRRSRTLLRDRPETVRLHPGTAVHLHPGILFGINPERRSESSRNRVHLAPDSPHERIVDQKVWERVQDGLRENGRTNGAVVKNKYGALLRGVLFCKHCGTAMMHTYTHKGPRRYRYYVCYKAQQKGWKNCQTKSVGAEAIEGAVLTSIRRLATDREPAEAVLAEAMTQLEGRTHELVAEAEEKCRKRRKGSGKGAVAMQRIGKLSNLLDLVSSVARENAVSGCCIVAVVILVSPVRPQVDAKDSAVVQVAEDVEHPFLD